MKLSMRKEFYIFRHGETDLNKQRRWQGSGCNYDLNDVGVEQAKDAASKFADKEIEVIFSSPLVRAHHTANIIAETIHVPVIAKDDLRECFYGDAEGALISDLERDVPDIINNWSNPECMDIRFAKGESKREALQRVLAVLNSLLGEKYKVMGIAVHNGTMGALLNFFGKAFDRIPNCGAFHLIFDETGWHVESEIF